MSKLKIDKIKLQDLSKEEQKEINGGEQISTISITIGTVSVAVKTIADATHGITCHSRCDCLTAKPGHQDSCGLCTTNYHC